MEALGYLAFSAVLYLTCNFFRIIFREYIFNKELYLPDDTSQPSASEEEHSADWLAYLRQQAC